VDERKVDMINQGRPPIYENGLAPLLRKHIGKHLIATTDLKTAVQKSDISLIAVGTPFDGDRIDLSFVRSVAEQIGNALRTKNEYHVVVVKSTVVPGTTDEVVTPVLEKASAKIAGRDFGVGMNPEFLREGEAVADFMEPDRIVLGALDQKSLDVMMALYAPFDKVDIIKTNSKTAEMIKYTANSLLATMISFSNEIANLCGTTGGVDVKDVMRGVHLDKRLSPIMEDGRRITPGFTTYIEAGCGFGGSCFPKDVKALIAYGKQLGEPMQLLQSVIHVNQNQPGKIITLLEKHFPNIEGLSIAILGLAFKPETDDMRESPAIPVIKALHDKKVRISAFDPIAQKEAQHVFSGFLIDYAASVQEAVSGADAVVILTRWKEFDKLPAILKDLGSMPLVVDGRRMLDKTLLPSYAGIGL
jgi:UDPglucose 6-dehydrogenase